MDKFTDVYEKVDGGWIGYVEELPGANTQGKTREEARENLKEAVQLIIEANNKFTLSPSFTTPYRPLAFGGLWKDENIDDKDIDEVRREMWQSLEDREL